LEDRLAVVLPVALAPTTVRAAGEPGSEPVPSDDEATVWPEGATTIAVTQVPEEAAAAAEPVPEKRASDEAGNATGEEEDEDVDADVDVDVDVDVESETVKKEKKKKCG
jgi:hypothetical protein